MSPAEQETYIERLGKLGYCWQFITLAGLHTTALASRKISLFTALWMIDTDGGVFIDTFAESFSRLGMKAYGNLVQEPEMEKGIDVVLHQKWSGANYADSMLKMVTGGVSSTAAMGQEVTESQFTGFTKN